MMKEHTSYLKGGLTHDRIILDRISDLCTWTYFYSDGRTKSERGNVQQQPNGEKHVLDVLGIVARHLDYSRRVLLFIDVSRRNEQKKLPRLTIEAAF